MVDLRQGVFPAVRLSAKLIKKYFGYFHPKNMFLDTEFYIFWGDLTDISARQGVFPAVLLSAKSNQIYFGYFDPKNVFLDNEFLYFSG